MYRELYQLYILTMITVPIIIVIGVITAIALVIIAMSLIKLNRNLEKNLDANCYEDTKTINEDTDFTVTDFD